MPLPQAMRCAARLMLAVSSTMQGLLPPSSSTTGEELGRRLHDGVADVGAAGEEDLIPAHLQKPVVHLTETGEAAYELGREDLGDHVDEQGAGGLRRARGLERHAVAGRDGVDHGHERQLQRVVPRREHQHHAQRAGVDLRRGVEVHERRGDAFGARPLVEVLEHHRDLVVDDAQLGGVALERGFAQILLQGVEHARVRAARSFSSAWRR